MSGCGQILRVILSLIVLSPFLAYAQPSLVWDPNLEEDLAGYRVYLTDASKTYPPFEISSLSSLHSLTNLDAESTYWIYVTAFNTNNIESAPSNVLQFPDSPVCNYAVHPRNGAVGPWPQIDRFRVTSASRCLWQAEALDEWIHIITASTGQGMAEVYYSVDQNTQPYPRQGLIRVADQFYSVYQTAAGITPIITTHLGGSVQLVEGQQLDLYVNATDESELRYQWYRSGTLIPSATNSYLTIFNIAGEQAGEYTVAVSSAVRTLIEGPAFVSVYARPRISESGQPRNIVVIPGEAAFLQVAAAGPDLRYEWFKNGKLVSTAGPVLSLPAVSSNDFGVYQVRVSNGLGGVVSDLAAVSEATPEQVAGAITVQGDSASFRIEASGIPGETYQIQISTNLESWLTIETVEVNSTGKFTIQIPESFQAERWFLRTVRQRKQPLSP